MAGIVATVGLMGVLCLNCKHMTSTAPNPTSDARSVAARRDLLRQGQVYCKQHSKHQGDTYSALFERQCAAFVGVPAGDVAKRRKWIESLFKQTVR